MLRTTEPSIGATPWKRWGWLHRDDIQPDLLSFLHSALPWVRQERKMSSAPPFLSFCMCDEHSCLGYRLSIVINVRKSICNGVN